MTRTRIAADRWRWRRTAAAGVEGGGVVVKADGGLVRESAEGGIVRDH